MASQRYDRQLRLWQESGQENLINARILCLGSNTLASETLKSLVLAGIGHVTIVDDVIADESNSSTNFFVNSSSYGQRRAKIISELLKQLNPSVDIVYEIKSPNNYNMHYNWSLVISCVQPNQDLVRSAFGCCPFIQLISKGFYSSVYISIKEHTVVETHQSSTPDLRLDKPWPELLAYIRSIDLKALDPMDHAHVPYVVLLIIFLDQYKAASLNDPSSDQKSRFKNLIRASAPSTVVDTENYEQASHYSYLAFAPTEIPSAVESILSESATMPISSLTPKFWILAKALSVFADKHGVLPLSGVLPDMKADSQQYIALQNIYKAKADQDIAEFKIILNSVLEDISSGSPPSITPTEIESFCKNARFLTVLRQESPTDFTKPPDTFNNDAERIFWTLIDPSPGLGDNDPEMSKLLQVTASPEQHNVSAFAAGVASQEATKILTRHYIPHIGALVYDGVHGTLYTP
ncbi:hypothetical protein CANCADRAFT_3631 [Tortispora caseinolytica NRRL Y-17796]|uniref:NEDD8-activating enzyme E1 regulatory subunit n=1 Tax=Tortispora caseinolytica NRRL Y-17796 TaxID=767744 RepID=A0A1E4TB78_9ASCO|nr:hypothetical protein CANCADRAFT_3631 [Tortispora caseinolytica NRRL Y-17796]